MHNQKGIKELITNLKNIIKNIDKNVIKLINLGTNIAYIICIIGIITLYIEYKKNISLELLSIGLSVFKLGIIIAAGFVVIGFGLGAIKVLENE